MAAARLSLSCRFMLSPRHVKRTADPDLQTRSQQKRLGALQPRLPQSQLEHTACIFQHLLQRSSAGMYAYYLYVGSPKVPTLLAQSRFKGTQLDVASSERFTTVGPFVSSCGDALDLDPFLDSCSCAHLRKLYPDTTTCRQHLLEAASGAPHHATKCLAGTRDRAIKATNYFSFLPHAAPLPQTPHLITTGDHSTGI